jgi:phytoene/squalene synthetase
MLHTDLQKPVYNIYGFVRLADEIVDSFHEHDKAYLLQQFKNETFDCIERKISLNPILNSFQKTVNEYNIDLKLVEAFFHSMSQDLQQSTYNLEGYKEYIYGSAEVVGLMCLYVFCDGKQSSFDNLEKPACALGAAFQKVNFLRDMKADYNGLSRIYFPGCDFNNFNDSEKKQIEADIENDFREAYQGIFKLPWKARFGVYVAFKYYYSLFKKIKRMKPARVLEERIRIPNYYKAMIFLRAGVKNQLRLI